MAILDTEGLGSGRVLNTGRTDSIRIKRFGGQRWTVVFPLDQRFHDIKEDGEFNKQTSFILLFLCDTTGCQHIVYKTLSLHFKPKNQKESKNQTHGVDIIERKAATVRFSWAPLLAASLWLRGSLSLERA